MKFMFELEIGDMVVTSDKQVLRMISFSTDEVILKDVATGELHYSHPLWCAKQVFPYGRLNKSIDGI